MRSINLSRRSFLSGAAAASALGVMALSGCAPQAEPAKEVAETGTAPKEVVETIDTDLLIVGLGGSGLACAVQAALDDTNCLVIEKNAESGGNALGVEGMFAINSSMQKAAGIEEITPAEVIAAQMEMLQYRPTAPSGSNSAKARRPTSTGAWSRGWSTTERWITITRAFCIPSIGSRKAAAPRATCPR